MLKLNFNLSMQLPNSCPSCQASLQVATLSCSQCATTVNGQYDLPILAKLSPQDQNFILQFFLTSGSIKEMASKEQMSYPTMRNKLDDLILKLKTLIHEENH